MNREAIARVRHAANLRQIAKGLEKLGLDRFAESCTEAANYLDTLTRAKLVAQKVRLHNRINKRSQSDRGAAK